MNPFLPLKSLGAQSRDLLRIPVSVGSASRWWLLCYLLVGLSTVGWGQCFNKTTLYAGPGTLFVAVADFNGDGRADLASSNVGDNTVTVRLGDGSGGFGDPVRTIAGSQPIPIAVADFNSDGRADLALGNDRSNNVTVLLGNGNGSFGTATDFPAGGNASSVVAADFNGDGKVDLATANRYSNTVSVLLGTGSGGFGTATIFGVGASPGLLVVGDFNNDGRPDLAVPIRRFTEDPSLPDNVSVLLGDGSGGFGTATAFPVGRSPGRIALGDVNGDGNVDLAVTIFSENTVSVLLGTGNGGFGAATNFGVDASPGPVTVSDFNGDGRLDLVITIQRANPNFSVDDKVSVLLGNGNGGFGAPSDFPIRGDLGSTVVSDFNSDGRPDLIGVSGQNADELLVLINCTPPAGFGITSVTPVRCTTVTATERQFTFAPQYAGLNGQPVSFSVVNEMFPTTSPGPYTLRLYTDNPIITLKASQTGSPGESSFNYNWLAVCQAGFTPPPPFTITGVTPVRCTTVTATERQLTFTPQYAGLNGQPISFSVVLEMLPTTNPGPYTLRLFTDNPTINLRAKQVGSEGEASFAYNWLAVCQAGFTPPPPFVITSVTPVSCATVTATERRLTFAPQYAGLNGQPVSFSVVNEMFPTTSSGPYTLRLYTDNPIITLKASQTGSEGEASFTYNWLAVCGGGGAARLSVSTEPIGRLQVKALNNPVREVVEVEVTGSENKSLQVTLTDMRGRIVGQRRAEQAGAAERYRFDVSTLPAGLLLLRASIQGQSETVRILKLD